MLAHPRSSVPAQTPATRRLFRNLLVLAGLFGFSVAVFAQQQGGQADDTTGGRRRRNQDTTNANGNGGNGGGRGNFDPSQMQERLLSALRDRMDVKDDAEWSVISDRVTKINDLRQQTMGGGNIGQLLRNRDNTNGGGNGGGNNFGGRGARGGSPEMQALMQGLNDNLPDAEIKARLERLQAVRKTAADQLAKAQEELRAVLTIRQEAVAVMFGLLQ